MESDQQQQKPILENQELFRIKTNILIDSFKIIKELQIELSIKLDQDSFKISVIDSFKSGWNYVKTNNREGLVIRNDFNWFKVKALQEVKEEIVGHERGTSLKGTFILKSGNRVSGTSEDFVKKYLDLKAKGFIVMAECEYPFITDNGKYFQPRLRKVYISNEIGD